MTAAPDVRDEIPDEVPMSDPISRHEIKIRKPAFDYGDTPRYWLAGNAVATHFFNGLNMVFPDGERFFVRSVRDHQSRIDEPELSQQIRGFSGQEARHALEHENYFETLKDQGYEIDGFLARFQSFVAWSTRWLPASFRLSVTAGAEHYTATLGANALELPLLNHAHPTMKALIYWHACEEIEHKAVAFDVLRATHPSYLLRMAGFVFATFVLFGWAIVGTRMLLRQDVKAGRISNTEIREMQGELRELNRPEWRRMAGRVKAYLRRDFHPNEVDHLELAYAKLEEIGLRSAS